MFNVSFKLMKATKKTIVALCAGLDGSGKTALLKSHTVAVAL